ncbi:MAG: ABC transporter substrate-binding protein [Saprospiraceae bacterium]
MISAQNHPQPSNGNSWLIMAGLVLLYSCATTKNAGTPKDVQIVKSDKSTTPSPTGKKDSDIKAKSSGEILVSSKIDTIIWQDVTPYHPPITVRQPKKAVYKEGLEFRDEYNVKLLIPLNSDGTNDPTKSKFAHFYAGILQALEVLDVEGIKINLTVIDTEEGDFNVQQNISNLVDDNTDLIIGPFERDDVKVIAEECKIKSVPVVSPWQTSTKITNENPYYIQIKPNLKEHFIKLANSTSREFGKGEVAIICKRSSESEAWIKFFQEAAFNNNAVNDFFSTYFVSPDSLANGPSAFSGLFRNPKIKAIILPNYSYNDESFIYSCLRRLNAEKAGRNISVYGMPILFDSDKIEFEYYYSLNINVVMSDFVDPNQSAIREFRRDFLNLFGEIPDVEAIKGYDLALYLGRNIWKYGKNFQNYLENEPGIYLQSSYNIQKSKSDDSQVIDDPYKFDYYENKHLDIIEFSGNKWQIKW